MILHRTNDMDVVRFVMTLPDIRERSADDLAAAFEPKTDNAVYLLAIEGDEIAGVIEVEGTTSIELTIHPYLIKKYRYLGREMMRLFFEVVLDSEYQKVSAQIPVCYKQVINFAKKVGFSIEGINRLSAIKNGVIQDQVIIGITRSEIEDIYGQHS